MAEDLSGQSNAEFRVTAPVINRTPVAEITPIEAKPVEPTMDEVLSALTKLHEQFFISQDPNSRGGAMSKLTQENIDAIIARVPFFKLLDFNTCNNLMKASKTERMMALGNLKNEYGLQKSKEKKSVV